MSGFIELTTIMGNRLLVGKAWVTSATDDPQIVSAYPKHTQCIVGIDGRDHAVQESFDAVKRALEAE